MRRLTGYPRGVQWLPSWAAAPGEDVLVIGESQQVQGRLITDEVIDMIRRRIHLGQWETGDRLPAERELAEQLGVGRVTLREALSVLQREGYLIARRGARGGTFVTELEVPYQNWVKRMRGDIDELRDILDFREAVEVHAARLAADRRNQNHVEQLHQAIRAFDRVEDLSRFRELDSKFHETIAIASGSPRLRDSVHQARGELFLRADMLTFDLGVDDVIRQHTAIFEPIRDRDPAAAAAATVAHLNVTRTQLMELLGVPEKAR